MNVRPLFVLMLAALLAPAAAHAVTPKSGGTGTRPASASTGDSRGSSGGGLSIQGLSVGGFVGYETDEIGGFTLRGDAELPFRNLTPEIKLSWVGSVGYSRLTKTVGPVDTTVNILKLVPAARFTLPVNPQLSVFADAGLGLYYLSWKSENAGWSVSDSEFSFMMRLGVGAFYQVNPKTQVGALLELDPMFGDFDANTWNFLVGAMFKL